MLVEEEEVAHQVGLPIIQLPLVLIVEPEIQSICSWENTMVVKMA